MNIDGMVHVNINCTNYARSRRFVKCLVLRRSGAAGDELRRGERGRGHEQLSGHRRHHVSQRRGACGAY